jgi:cyclophilin family peptidyl-prolyl cis-trans isomerase
LAAVPSSEKRQRKKENARMAREARLAAEKRRKRFRTARNVGIVAVIFIGGIVLFNVLSNKSSSKKASSTTTVPTTIPEATTTIPVALPAGCVEKVPPQTKKPQNLKAPAVTIDASKTYTAQFSTTCGNFTIALDAKNAPKSVNNFVYLARMGFFDGLRWHRVATDPPIIQGGDPEGNGNGGPGYSTVVELPPDGKYPKGAVAWAKTSTAPKGSAGSQFFVDTGDASAIGDDYGYIGKVSTGQDVVDKMGSLATPSETPAYPLYIDKVTISES